MFNTTITLVMNCLPQLVSGFNDYFVGLSSGRLNERTWHISFSMGATVVGSATSYVTMNSIVRYITRLLFRAGVYAANSVILGWLSVLLG